MTVPKKDQTKSIYDSWRARSRCLSMEGVFDLRRARNVNCSWLGGRAALPLHTTSIRRAHWASFFFVPRRHARAPASCHAAALLPRREPGAACHALQAQRGRMESERKREGERERETERARERPIGPPLKPSLGPHWGHPGLLLGPSQRPEGVWAPQDPRTRRRTGR